MFTNVKVTSKSQETCNCFLIVIVHYITILIDNKTFYFNSFVSSTNVDSILETPQNLPRNCKGSEYVYKDYGNMITIDLSITSNIKLLEMLCKCPKFGEKKCTDFKKSKTIILDGIDDCINTRFPKKIKNPKSIYWSGGLQ